MQKFLAIALVVLLVALDMGTASAQVRVQGYQNPGAIQRIKPRLKQIQPRVIIIPPSRAVQIAAGALGNAKPLGVTLKGRRYIVKLKQGGTIVQMGVNARTGAVTRLR